MSFSVSSVPRGHCQVSHSSVVTSVAFSPDGSTLASGSWDGTVKLWDLRDGKPKLQRTLRGQWDEVEAVAFTPDGGAIAGVGTGFDDAPFGVVTVWAAGAGRGRALVREVGKIDTIAFSPDGRTLATGSGDHCAVKLWDVANGEEKAILDDHRGPIRSVTYAPGGRCLAVASGMVPAMAELLPSGPVGEICLWDLSGRKPKTLTRLSAHDYGIISVAFSPDGTFLASGGFDRTVKLWGMETCLERATLDGHKGWVAAVAFGHDGSLLASASHDQTIKLWDTATGHELATLVGHSGNIYSVAFSPDGSCIASGSLDGTVRLWDVDQALASPGVAGTSRWTRVRRAVRRHRR